jgi:hypothetical protein
MELIDAPKRPVKIKLLNIEHKGFNAIVSYRATYTDNSTKTIQTNVKRLNTLSLYPSEPHIIKTKFLGKVQCGVFHRDTRYLFIVKFSDYTVDLIQKKAGASSDSDLWAMSFNEEASI